ncbi:hypothetical protein Tco_0281319 [Tanacetum coccineum]
MTKVIKEEFQKLESFKIGDDSFACNTSLKIFHDEFKRMSRMDDDLFNYEVEISGLANIPCDLNKDDDSKQQMTHGSGDDMEYDPSDARGDDEVELTDEESSDFDDDDEVAEIFRIDTNVFDFKTPMCRAFKEFNYLSQIDPDVLTINIEGFKTYKDYKDDWIYKWNEDVPWVHERPWTDNGAWEEPIPDGKLIDEGLKNKAILEGMIDDDDESHNNGWKRWDILETTNRDHEEREYEMEHDDKERCELFNDQEWPVCNIRRFEMIKYSFRYDEESVDVKENEYDDLTSARKEAIHAYQEIFRMMDEGWMVTRAV